MGIYGNDRETTQIAKDFQRDLSEMEKIDPSAKTAILTCLSSISSAE